MIRHENLESQSRLIHQDFARSAFGETSEPIHMTSGFVYESAEQAAARFAGEDDGYVYSRYGNPTVDAFERKLAALEGKDRCFATSSGMAAIYAALLCQLKTGDRVVASRVLFGSCAHIVTKLLPRLGIETTLVDGTDLKAWEAALNAPGKSKPALVFFESPANPTLELVDIKAVTELAHSLGVRVVLDNAFASPIAQPTTDMSVDVVAYSATKHIDGQGRCLGGAVLCDNDFYDELLLPFVRHTGPAMSAFNAWVLTKAMDTLALRVERMSESALLVAQQLDEHPAVTRVNYPFLENFAQFDLAKSQMVSGGSLLSFRVKYQATAFGVLNRLTMIKISNNLGDARSLAVHPATTTHRAMGAEDRANAAITDDLVRISVGLEAAQDVAADLMQALG